MDRASAIGEHEPWSKPWGKHEQHESIGTNTPKLGLAGCSYVANTHVLSTSASFPCPKCSSELRRPNHLAARPCVRGNASRVIIGCARGLGMAIKAELMGSVHEINRAGRVARNVSSQADANSSLQMLYVEATPNKEQPPLTCGNGSGSGSAPGRRCCSFATAGGVDDRIGARGCPGCLIKPPTSESLTGLQAAQNSEQQ